MGTGTAAVTASCCSSRPTACARTQSRKYADKGAGARLPRAAQARRVRVRQRPADAGAAEHRRGLVHARHGRVAGRARLDQQHVPHQRRARSPTRRPRSAPRTCCRPRRSRSRPSAAARRSRRSSGPAAAAASINGPTLDFRNFRSGRGVATNYIVAERHPGSSRVVRPAVRPSGRVRRQRAVPAGRAGAATGWTDVPRSYSPAKEMRLRCSTLDTGDGQVRPQRLHLRLAATTAGLDYDRVLFSPHEERRRQGRRPQRGRVRRRQGQDRRDRRAERQDRRVPGQGRAAVTRPLAGPALPHLGHARDRDLADLDREPGFTGTFEDFVAERFPSSQAGDFAVLEAGIVSEETYIEQGEYWETAYHPLIKYVLDKYKPDLALVGYPGTDEIQHQFLGLVTKKLPNGAANPAYDDVEVNGTPDGRVKQREAFIREAYEGSDETMRLAQKHMQRPGPEHVRVLRPRLRAAVPGHRREQGAGRPRPAVDAADVQLPTGHDGDDRQREGLLRGRRRADLPQPRRARPGAADGQHDQADRGSRRGDDGRGRSGPRSRRSRTRNDWTGDGQPEGWKVIDRTLHQGRGAATSRTARTAPPTWRTRPGRATSSCSPTRRTSSTRRRRAR